MRSFYTLHWRHNDHGGVSNHQPRSCLLNRLFRRRWKKTPKLRVTGLCAGDSPGPVNSRHKWPVTRKMFPFDDVIMNQLHEGSVTIHDIPHALLQIFHLLPPVFDTTSPSNYFCNISLKIQQISANYLSLKIMLRWEYAISILFNDDSCSWSAGLPGIIGGANGIVKRVGCFVVKVASHEVCIWRTHHSYPARKRM